MIKEETNNFHKIVINDIKKYIKQNAGNTKITAKMICARSGYSSAYMRRLFKKWTGYGLSEYIKREHMVYIENALKNTSLPISEIAASCGYLSLSELTKRFKLRHGMPPSQYRIRHIQNIAKRTGKPLK